MNQLNIRFIRCMDGEKAVIRLGPRSFVKVRAFHFKFFWFTFKMNERHRYLFVLNWVSEQSSVDVDVDRWSSFLSIQMAFPSSIPCFYACMHSFIHSSIHSSQFPELILCHFSKHCRFNKTQRWMHSMHGYAWIRKFIQLCIICQMSLKILKWHISLCTTIRVQHTRHKHFDLVFISCRLHSFNALFIIYFINDTNENSNRWNVFFSSVGWGLWIFVEKLQTHRENFDK